jgi:hypothetical protein
MAIIIKPNNPKTEAIAPHKHPKPIFSQLLLSVEKLMRISAETNVSAGSANPQKLLNTVAAISITATLIVVDTRPQTNLMELGMGFILPRAMI